MLDVPYPSHTVPLRFNWQDFISTMINTFTWHIADIPAQASYRVGGTTYDLVVCTSLPSQSEMDCESSACNDLGDGGDSFGPLVKLEDKRTGDVISDWVLPAAWVVPMYTGDSSEEGFWMSPTAMSTLQVIDYTGGGGG